MVKLRKVYLRALEAVKLTDFATDSGTAYRTLQAYRRGERRITIAAAVKLATYLRARAARLDALAREVEDAIQGEERRP